MSVSRSAMGSGGPHITAGAGGAPGGTGDTAAGRAPAWSRAARRAASLPIVAYQRLISPALPRRCRYEPTCSRYAIEAIREYGILRGLVLAGWRLVRCNPLSDGGYDPVEAQRVFRTRSDSGS